jgi:hypothetical protein
MALLRFLLISAGLTMGLVGALTAYTVPLTDQLTGLTLNADAGNAAAPGERPRAILKKDAVLDAESIAVLRAASVERVKVKEFSLRRWTGVWVFAVGVACMIGAVFVRPWGARAVQAPAGPAAGATADASQMLSGVLREVSELRGALAGTPQKHARLALIRARIDQVMQTHIAGIIAARAELTGRLGLARYANFIEAFAAGERALNRAWSAAADEHEPESLGALGTAEDRFAEAARRLG